MQGQCRESKCRETSEEVTVTVCERDDGCLAHLCWRWGADLILAIVET